MDKNGVVTISDWQKGASTSPYFGFGAIQNCEVFETPGVLKVAKKLTTQLSTTQITVARLQASNGDFYVLTRGLAGTSTLYKNGVSFTNVDGNAWDMIEYKGYLIISSNTGLHTYGITTTTAYFSLWKTGLTSSYYIKMIVGQDDKVYLTNGNYIATITDFVAGSFSVAPTATLTLSALDLKDGQYAVTIQELGRNIMIGTQGGSAWYARGGQRVANIYPWDRTSGTLGNPGLADLPISLNECGIHAMLSVNNIMYVLAGTRGNVYKTDGTSFVKIGRIPWTRSNSSFAVAYYPNALCLNSNSNLYIGLSVYSGSVQETGVWEMDIQNSNALVLKYKKANSEIGFVGIDTIETTYVGWGTTQTTFGLDYITTQSNTDYSAFAESQVYIVGNTNTKKTFEHIEFNLGKLLTYSQGIKLYYRTSTEVDYTLIGTYTYTTLGSVISFQDIAGITDAQILQIKVAIKQDEQDTPSMQWDLELVNVKLW
jgi:hypothetical protein